MSHFFLLENKNTSIVQFLFQSIGEDYKQTWFLVNFVIVSLIVVIFIFGCLGSLFVEKCTKIARNLKKRHNNSVKLFIVSVSVDLAGKVTTFKTINRIQNQMRNSEYVKLPPNENVHNSKTWEKLLNFNVRSYQHSTILISCWTQYQVVTFKCRLSTFFFQEEINASSLCIYRLLFLQYFDCTYKTR